MKEIEYYKKQDKKVRDDYNLVLKSILTVRLQKANCSEQDIKNIIREVDGCLREENAWEEINSGLLYELGYGRGNFNGILAMLAITTVAYLLCRKSIR